MDDKNKLNNNSSFSSSNNIPPKDLLILVNPTQGKNNSLNNNAQTGINNFNNLSNKNNLNNTSNNNTNNTQNKSYIFVSNNFIKSAEKQSSNSNGGVNNNSNKNSLSNNGNGSLLSLTDEPQSNFPGNLKSQTSVNSSSKSSQNNNETFSKMSLEELMKGVASPKVALEIKTKKENKWFFGISIISAICFIVIFTIVVVGKGRVLSFIGGTPYYQNKSEVDYNADYPTVVSVNNKYTGVTFKNEEEAKALIVKDSNNQKVKCTNEKVKEIETRIEKTYNIVAVNLCEMDYNFSLQLENVLKRIYKEFPGIDGYLTNLTIKNPGDDYNTMASFKSAEWFAKSATLNSRPQVYKMSVFLNSNYFLDPNFNEMVSQMSITGFYIPNATRYTVLAHEMGHYLSFLAQLNNTKDIDKLLILDNKNVNSYKSLIDISNNGSFSYKIVNEAYLNYTRNHPGKFSNLDEFRRSISEYAVAVDVNGNFIYDETIAEAFHDYYVNKTKARDASKEIVKVLKKYLTN